MPSRSNAIRTESTMKGISSMMIWTMVCDDFHPCVSIVGSNTLMTCSFVVRLRLCQRLSMPPYMLLSARPIRSSSDTVRYRALASAITWIFSSSLTCCSMSLLTFSKTTGVGLAWSFESSTRIVSISNRNESIIVEARLTCLTKKRVLNHTNRSNLVYWFYSGKYQSLRSLRGVSFGNIGFSKT